MAVSDRRDYQYFPQDFPSVTKNRHCHGPIWNCLTFCTHCLLMASKEGSPLPLHSPKCRNVCWKKPDIQGLNFIYIYS